jgi:hypothetical protein
MERRAVANKKTFEGGEGVVKIDGQTWSNYTERKLFKCAHTAPAEGHGRGGRSALKQDGKTREASKLPARAGALKVWLLKGCEHDNSNAEKMQQKDLVSEIEFVPKTAACTATTSQLQLLMVVLVRPSFEAFGYQHKREMVHRTHDSTRAKVQMRGEKAYIHIYGVKGLRDLLGTRLLAAPRPCLC